MILVTVGTQLPFDRLVRAVELWCLKNNYHDVIFQVGVGGYHPSIGESFDFIQVNELDDLFVRAKIIVGHAGIGTILTALTNATPVVIMPREYKLSEHRSDHQIATYDKFYERDGIFGARNGPDIEKAIGFAYSSQNTVTTVEGASKDLILYLRSLIFS